MKPPLIVLIEDSDSDVFLLRKALADARIAFTLTRFESGVEAVAILCQGGGPLNPDMILLDLNTPRSDGFEVLEQLKNTPHLAGVPIAVLTSSQSNEDRKRAEAQGARFLQKPTQLDEFFRTVSGAVTEMLRDSGSI